MELKVETTVTGVAGNDVTIAQQSLVLVEDLLERALGNIKSACSVRGACSPSASININWPVTTCRFAPLKLPPERR